MTHYHVWFNVKPDVAGDETLAAIRTFRLELLDAGRLIEIQRTTCKWRPHLRASWDRACEDPARSVNPFS